MPKTIFAGRKNCKRDFADYLARMTIDAKGSRHLLSFKKKKDEDEIYPRIFLLYGDAGTGKSAMVGQYLNFARGFGSELKKPLKIVTVDCEEVLIKNVMMLRTLIQAIYGAFSSEDAGSAGSFSEFAQIERRITFVHEKVEYLCKHEWVGEQARKAAPEAPPAGGNPEGGAQDEDTFEAKADGDEEARRQTAFTKWLRETGKLQDDELDIYENSDLRLSKALVGGIVQLSGQYNIILSIDAFDRVSNREIEEWMRTEFLGKLFDRKNSVFVILSGRGNLVRNYRNDFPEELLAPMNFNDFPMTRSDIAECARLCQVKLTEQQIRRTEEVTDGIPFIVRNLLGLVRDNVSLEALLDDIGHRDAAIAQAIESEVKRFLTFCPSEAVKRKIVQCACMRRLENTVLSKLWNVAYSDIGPLIADYADRYPFIIDEQTPGRGYAPLREYCIKEMAGGANREIIAMVGEFGSLSAPLFFEQMSQLTTAVALIEKRYEDERFLEAILAYCNSLLWHDRERLFGLLPGILLECLQYNCTFAVRLLQCIDEFRVALSPDQIRVADIYISGVLSYHPMNIWLGTAPGEEEDAMIGILEERASDCSEWQTALLHCRRGELHYRRGEYEAAFELFQRSLPFVKDSEVFKKTLTDGLFALGNKLVASGSLETAVNVLKHVVELKPDDFEAWYTMGRAQTELGRVADSAFSYVKTVELKPDLHDAWHRLGIAYFTLESYENAVEALSRALELKTEDAVGWFTMGMACRRLERFEDAVAALGKAAALDGSDKNVWMESGAANAAIDRWEEAEVSFEKAVQLDAQLHEAWFGLGQAQFKLGRYKQATAALGTALGHVRDNKEYIHMMAMACHAAGDFDAAIRHWAELIEIDPANAQAHYRMALSLHARGQYSDAIQFYLKASEGLPDNQEITHNMGRAYHAQGLYNDAVEKYRKALQINPAKPEVWDDLGLVFTEMNLYGDAIQAYKELTALTPDWKDAWYHLGHTYYFTRHYENALQSYTKAVELDPGDVSAWGSLGLTYYAMRNYEKAVEASNKALAIKSDELWIQKNLALSTLLLGNIPQAAIEYDKVILLAKTREDLEPAIMTLEEVISKKPADEQTKAILEKMEKALGEK